MVKEFVYNEVVRIYDTDAQGIVHYAGYYRFFTDALEQFISSRMGDGFPKLSENVWFVVVESNAKYLQSARIGENLRISLIPNQLSEKAVRFDFRINRDNILICEGYITQVAIDKDTWHAVPVPKNVLNALFQRKS